MEVSKFRHSVSSRIPVALGVPVTDAVTRLQVTVPKRKSTPGSKGFHLGTKFLCQPLKPVD